MECAKEVSDLTEIEVEGLKEMKVLNQDFLKSGKGGKQVREFLINAITDDIVLLRYLRGRKNRPKHAWETLKSNAELRYEIYPDLFPDSLSKDTLAFIDSEAFGILKSRDSMGRIIGFFDTSKWDPDKITLKELIIMVCRLVDRALEKESSAGFVYLQECSGMSMKHAQQYTINNMLRLRNVFWYSYPVQLKGVWYVNLPSVMTFAYRLAKPLIPKKIKERLHISPPSDQFSLLHEKLSPDILPKCLGGNLEFTEAIDADFLK